MIRILEKIEDCVSEKYWNFVTEREFNAKDPHYFGKVSDEIAEELYDFFYDLISNESNLNESWISDQCLDSHFRTHCIKGDKKSRRSSVYYDFTSVDELKEYENKILHNVLNPDYKIISLYNTKEVFSALSELTTQPTDVLFDIHCGFKNSRGDVQIGLNSFADDVTTNYPNANTVNLLIISKADETISMYAVDANYIETKIKNIINNHIDDKNIKKLYK